MSAVIDRLLRPESGLSTRLFFLARRFVAGENIETALDAVRDLNAHGLSTSLDFLGEDVTARSEAVRTKDAYLTLLEAIRLRKADTNVSVKLTAMGLLFDEDLALANLNEIMDAAEANDDPFVRIDMEGSIVTARTLGLFERAFAQRKNVGIVIQSYLKRSAEDVERAIELGARVRLCKGAYREPPELAYQDMPTIRRAFITLAEALLTRGKYPAIATHDERIIEAVKAFARGRDIGKDQFEFQLLYGVKPELQRQLAADGYKVRVYVPFGTHWAGYFYRRIAERRENALFALGSMFTK
jgi:proline dehydrogenase